MSSHNQLTECPVTQLVEGTAVSVEAVQDVDGDCVRIAQTIDRSLDLASASLPDEYYYSSLPLCVIDAVFSIGVRYSGVQATVRRYCERFARQQVRKDRGRLPPRDEQESISELCAHFEDIGIVQMEEGIFRNRQRTSTRNGIPKADAVWRFARALRSKGIECLQDVSSSLPTGELEKEIRAIPGQLSGISLQYFWMLAGSEDLIKPDRMIMRFLERCLDRKVPTQDALHLLRGATDLLRPTYPQLTSRLLDYVIWKSESQKAAGRTGS